MARHRSSAWPLAAACACLIVYASLHPFTGWVWPDRDRDGWQLLRLTVPQPRGVGWFDIIGNLVAYVPLGALLAAGWLRAGRGRVAAALLSVLLGSGLSYAMEQLQRLLPVRVSSLIDWELNTAGTVLGVALMLAVHALGGFGVWQRWRERWLLRGRGGGLALLLLWPFGLLFPPPVPFGLGQVLGRARDLLAEALDGTPWAAAVRDFAGWETGPLPPNIELIGITAGLLGPCLLAYALTRPGLRRLPLMAGAVVLGVSVTTLSTALNVGPDHAFAWLTPQVLPGIGAAAGIAMLLAWLPARLAAFVAVLVTSFAIALVNVAPGDAYFDASLLRWEQGRFIRFHGLSQWIGWLWPYASLCYLLGRVGSRAE